MNLDKLISEAKNYLSKEEIHKLKKAYEFAKKAHHGQKRKSGEPYILHPLEATYILIKMRADICTLIAAILHDVPEDTDKSLNEIRQNFGDEVAFLVNGITKISSVYFRTDMAERQVESLKKLLLHCAKDSRVILIKLADRLHNMQTLYHIPKKQKRERIAKETLEIYVPIANLFGLGEIKIELEDLCFKELYSEKYEEIEKRLHTKEKAQKELIEQSIKKINKELEESKIQATVVGRRKSFYSIYKKIKDNDYKLSDIEDIIGIRIICKKKEECYSVLGVIHNIFKPKPRRVKDYIAVPKTNGYQSLHTTVFGLEGTITEIQIRTEQMHLEAEYGIAAHYFYKTKADENFQWNTRKDWAQEILDIQLSAKDNDDLLQKLKLNIFQDRIFCFTPRGDVIDLPAGATAIDFAYSIHSEVGNKADKAEINGEIVSILSTLNTGDVIKIITEKDKKYPNLNWLSYAKTNAAKKNIREQLKKLSESNRSKAGKDLLKKELQKSEKSLADLSYNDFLKIFKKFNLKSISDLFLEVGIGNIPPEKVFNLLNKKDEKKSPLDKVKKILFKKEKQEEVGIEIESQSRPFQIQKIMEIVNKLNIKIVGMNAVANKKHNQLTTRLFFPHINDDLIDELFEKLEQIDGIVSIRRLFPAHVVQFYLLGFATIIVWTSSPLILSTLPNLSQENKNNISRISLYLGIFLLLATIYKLKKMVDRRFPTLREHRFFWSFSFLTVSIAMIAIIAKILFNDAHFNWIAILAIISFAYSALISEYINQYYLEQ